MKKFINPYNFIPLMKTKGTRKEEEELLTGVISYQVMTKTPLFIPNTSNPNLYGLETDPEPGKARKPHKSMDFFSYHDWSQEGICWQDGTGTSTYVKEPLEKPFSLKKAAAQNSQIPVIPGSEIRGMFRSNYEILTNSCMSSVQKDKKIGKRTAQVFRPGLLRKVGNVYHLIEADPIYIKVRDQGTPTKQEMEQRTSWYTDGGYTADECMEGCKVQVRIKKFTNKEKPKRIYGRLDKNGRDTTGYTHKEGYLHKGELDNNGRKCNYAVFCVRGGGKAVRNRIALDELDEALKIYDKESNSYHEYREQYEKFKKGELNRDHCFPVYYSQVAYDAEESGANGENHIMLSPACITREIYEKKIADFLGDHAPCSGQGVLCPACSLFGTLEAGDGISSRIRFTDLMPVEKKDPEDCHAYYEDPVTLPPLSTPKISSMEFYLKRPEGAVFWTYDYYIDSEGELHAYKYEEGKTGIAGRKFYWHNPKMTLPHGEKKTELNMTVHPVKGASGENREGTGICFQGKLYFDRISRTELNQLIWLLNAGENPETKWSERKHGYKLGAAKPLGFGSIAVKTEEIKLRCVSCGKEGTEICEVPYQEYDGSNLFEETIKKQFQTMTAFDSLSGIRDTVIRYPRKRLYPNVAEENGYEWFMENHKAYDYRNDRFKGMATGRADQVFMQYMEPMRPTLRSVEFPSKTGTVLEVDWPNKRAKVALESEETFNGGKPPATRTYSFGYLTGYSEVYGLRTGDKIEYQVMGENRRRNPGEVKLRRTPEE